MTFRLIMQPVVAVFLAIRAGLRDAREGRPPFLWAVVSDPARRRESFRDVLGDLRNIFLVAIALDAIYQVIVHSGIYTLELLLTATTLAVVPYAIARGLVTRLARRLPAAGPAGGRPGGQATPVEGPRHERQEG
ncbi:hypothetical protein ElP_26500 [Tautonia plasticadhaerens]|uniref:Uncharacterized protein n=2 Tax=Tautonia plasticadhaerens TaxID=2527974 RepID=A0A518H1N4_9BACT|nr:hypothetical protein ElP_26500 [Tautonia plasticadhaerens]